MLFYSLNAITRQEIMEQFPPQLLYTIVHLLHLSSLRFSHSFSLSVIPCLFWVVLKIPTNSCTFINYINLRYSLMIFFCMYWLFHEIKVEKKRLEKAKESLAASNFSTISYPRETSYQYSWITITLFERHCCRRTGFVNYRNQDVIKYQWEKLRDLLNQTVIVFCPSASCSDWRLSCIQTFQKHCAPFHR